MLVKRPLFKERELNVRLLAKNLKFVDKEHYFGTAPNVFVGRYGYPNINVGILNTEQYQDNDEPLLWAQQNASIEQILALRSAMVNSVFKSHVKSFTERFFEASREVSMATRPVDMEIDLAKKPNYQLKFDTHLMPVGTRVQLKRASITENPKIPDKVEKVVDDIDLKATDAIALLHDKGFDEHYLTKLLSVGNLGVKMERKLVPTRWAITATDDMIGKRLIREIQDYPETEHAAYFGSYLGNYFILLFFPGVWSYELFEIDAGIGSGRGQYTTDNENHFGRKTYASNTSGGYYAVRLAILEKLKELKRKGSVLALRFITNEYWASLGVWVVRSATRKAVQERLAVFSSKEEALQFAMQYAQKRFGIQLGEIFRKSIMLQSLQQQRRLGEFGLYA